MARKTLTTEKSLNDPDSYRDAWWKHTTKVKFDFGEGFSVILFQ
jgi:hypothetical protein